MKMGLTILAALALCAGLVFTAEREPEYELTAVEVRDIAEEIEIVGSVDYAQTHVLAHALSGTVARVFAQEGDRVTAGQALLEIEPAAGELALLLRTRAGSAAQGGSPSLAGSAAQGESPTQAETAEAALALCTITAPEDGILQSFSAQVGKSVLAGAEVGRVVSAEKAVTALLPESLREDVALDMAAEVARSGRTYSARISAIDAAPGAAAQYALRLEGGGLAALEAGMQVEVSLLLEEASGPSVPLQAVQGDGTIRCLTEQGAVCVPVTTGLCDALYVQLLSGPPVGTQVILGEAEA